MDPGIPLNPWNIRSFDPTNNSEALAHLDSEANPRLSRKQNTQKRKAASILTAAAFFLLYNNFVNKYITVTSSPWMPLRQLPRIWYDYAEMAGF